MASESCFTMTAELKNFFEAEGYELFKKVRVLTDEDSQNDPENNPFKSRYEAREHLQEILGKVHKEREESPSDREMLMLEGALQYHLGLNYIHTEERPTGEECLRKCMELLGDDVIFNKEIFCIALSAQSELGILWASRYQGAATALNHLDKAEKMYHKYKHDVGTPPFSVNELLQPCEKWLTDFQRENLFEKMYTHILFYLAQVHKNMEQSDLSAKYCQQTLRRQLESKEYDAKEWAVNSACLSQYYITKNMFSQAKHCLACANIKIDEAKPPEGLGDPIDDDEEVRKIRNAIPQRKADIARCWIKYCLSLLEYSKERLYDDVCELDTSRQLEAISQLQLENQNVDPPKNQERMPLEVDSVEEKVCHNPVVTFDEARELFMVGKRYVDIGLDFFVMDGYVTDNIELTQDMSSLYKHIIFFEQDKERKCKMHKRRIDLLSKVLNEINPKFYLLICRQLQFELGEIYSEMLDHKVSIANASGGTPTNHAIKKMNVLCRTSIHYFNTFLDTLKNLKKVLPDKFDEDVEHPAMIATFYLARLYSKILAPVASEKLQYLQMSLDHYTKIVDYVERNPQCEQTIPKEVEICREMTVLLPKAMERYMK